MINPRALTAEAAAVQRRLAADIAARAGELPELGSFLAQEYQRARQSERTQLAESQFRLGIIDQAAQSWVLAVCLVRFLEDTGLIPDPVISGPGARDQRARDALTLHFQAHPEHSEREYLEHVFTELSALPGLGELFDPDHQLLFSLGPSADGAKALIEFVRQKDPETGALRHDFTDPERSTRFLGDLYQDLSVEARKRYALLQTPEFIERFILDRTLEPAIREFGLENATLIDPACGSGHFLLGAFGRLFAHWRDAEPYTEQRVLAQRALDQIAGVDLNPIAAAIARFRLLVAALSAAKARTLKEAPDFQIQIAAADSLLHGPRPGQMPGAEGQPARRHYYRAEDAEAATRILSRSYACVVGNPPYITPKDPAENAAYRARYKSCHRKYSLVVPFIERFFDLASTDPAGYVGLIAGNAFMKREFGTVLINQFLPTWDLTHVIDTSGAYIPGHGTPTVILFARNRRPTDTTVRCVLGIRGEPSPPADPAKGLVWSAIEAQVDQSGSESGFISVTDMPRARLAAHPWSLGGGGAAELKAVIEGRATARLADWSRSSGFAAIPGEGDPFVSGPHAPAPATCRLIRRLVVGGTVRDWYASPGIHVIFPYSETALEPLASLDGCHDRLWPYRTTLGSRRTFSKLSYFEEGRAWWSWHQVALDKLREPLSMIFAGVATYNHFVLDRGGSVFDSSAPIIKLRAEATEDEHLALLGPLNSSTGCFWMKQVLFNKGSTVDHLGARQRTAPFEDFYAHDSTKLARFPLPTNPPTELARALDSLAQIASANTPAALCARQTPTREALNAARARWESTRRRMIALQEELDWRCYRLYGITDQELTYSGEVPEVAFGERAFEIVLARQMADDEVESAWFARHRAEPVTEIPARWPADYRELVQRRIDLIGASRDIALIERPEYKRRWAHEPWEAQEADALRSWLLDRLERSELWDSEPAQLQSVARLSDRLRDDPEFLAVVGLSLGRPDYDLTKAVADLVKDESVPYLAALRYSGAGLVKRAEWERVWELQRAEDAIDARSELAPNDPTYLSPDQATRLKAQQVGTITPPPRYVRTDYASGSYWSLRGKLDVPKERFISYPGAEREADTTAVIGWAGWDHRQRAVALASYIGRAQDTDGWGAERLTPLLAGLSELIPWLRQWHNDPDPQGTRFGDFAATFLADRTARVRLSAERLADWRPAPGGRGRRREKVPS